MHPHSPRHGSSHSGLHVQGKSSYVTPFGGYRRFPSLLGGPKSLSGSAIVIFQNPAAFSDSRRGWLRANRVKEFFCFLVFANEFRSAVNSLQNPESPLPLSFGTQRTLAVFSSRWSRSTASASRKLRQRMGLPSGTFVSWPAAGEGEPSAGLSASLRRGNRYREGSNRLNIGRVNFGINLLAEHVHRQDHASAIPSQFDEVRPHAAKRPADYLNQNTRLEC